MKLLHSADWHLDSPLPGKDPALKEALLAIPGKVAQAAKQEGAQLLLLSGDLFDGPATRASLDAIKILTDEGVKPEQICICHLDVEFNHEYLCQVFDTGVYAEFDDFGKEYYFAAADGAFAGGPFETDRDRVRWIIRMIKEGHKDRLLLATDVCLKALLHTYGGWGYDHIFTNITVMMENEGISKEDIHTILHENPTRFVCSRR